jgi:acyl dehydratase
LSARYFEDLAVGQKFTSPRLRVEKAAIKAFAAEFDPQPFHLDDRAARATLFEGLAASGWHTAALTMRLCVASDFRPAGGILGIGGELTWLKPVRPGDELRVECEVLEIVGLAGQQHEIEPLRQRVFGDDWRRRQIDVADAAADREASPGQLGGAPRAHEKGHVAAGLQQSSAEIPADRACADHEDPHLTLRSKEARYRV